MTKLIKKFQGGGNEIYRASYSLPEIKITDKQPEWFKYLNDYDKARLKSGQISAETAKSIAQKRATGTSQYMQDVNKLSWIPNGAMALAGGMALAGAPQAAKILGDAVFAADVLRAAEEEGMKQAVKENAPYLLASGLPLGATIGKGAGKAGAYIGKKIANITKPTKKVIEKEKINGIKGWFKYKRKELITPEVPGSPAVEATPSKVYNSKTKEWEFVPEGMRVEPYTQRGKNYFKLIAPDGTLYGKYLETAYKAGTEGKPAVETIPAVYKESEKLKPWVKWTTGLTPVGIATPYVINSIKTENSSQDIENQKSSLSQTDPDLFD